MLDIPGEPPISLLASSITLIVISTIAVIMRLISRRISVAEFWWDDVVSVVSLMIYVSDIHYPFSVSIIKLAILLFYIRLFGSRKGFRNILYATGALVISWFIGSTFAAIFRCTPISAAFILDGVYQEQHCIDTNAWFISTSVFNVLLDIWILALPLFVIWTLQLSLRRKVGVSGIFLLGAFTVGASIARACCVINLDLLDITWSSAALVFWSTIEISVGIICACLPTLQPVIGVFGRKIRETTSFSSGRVNRHKDLWYLESPVKRKEATNPISNEKNAMRQLSLGDVSWRALDYEGFGYDDAFKEVGLKHPSPC